MNGATGATGPTGPTGPMGAMGAMGAQGAPGDAGAPGPRGLSWRGAWSSTTAYAADDAVEFNGAAFIATAATTGDQPPAAPWDLLAAAGAQGPRGDPGVSVVGASLNVGDANCPAGGSSFTVGTSVTYACNGAVGPQGTQGPAGDAGPPGPPGPQGPPGTVSQRVFRYAQWSSYDQNYGWIGSGTGNGDPSLFGNVTPQAWGDGNAVASSMSPNAEILRTLFNKKLWVGANAMVAADTWISYSSTNSRHTGVLIRIENSTTAPINWPVSFGYTSYAGWNEYASASLNGAATWSSGAANTGSNAAYQQLTLAIPPGRSTFIVVSGSDAPSGSSRTNFLAFTNNCLTLPAGLSFVDDLDQLTGNAW